MAASGAMHKHTNRKHALNRQQAATTVITIGSLSFHKANYDCAVDCIAHQFEILDLHILFRYILVLGVENKINKFE